jgi:hypothetical protein
MFKQIWILKAIRLAAVVFLFAGILSYFLKFDLWDYDFWWHIATGRYIVETGTIPDNDPFSFTSNLEENKNPFPRWEKSILKQYWLSQVIFYFIYDYTGAAGIILLRSILLTLVIVFVFWMLHRWSVSLPVSFVFVFILFTLLQRTTGERPVLFTMLFTVLTFFILEDFKEKKDKKIFFLPPLMFFWANLHGGFILGVVIIMVFMFGEGVKIILKKSVYGKNEIILFCGATALSLIFSFINPTGWDAFSFAFLSKYNPLREGVHEYYSPFFMYKNKLTSIHYGYLFLALSFPPILILRNKRLDLSHAILLSGTFLMSLSAMRFIIFYTIIGSMVIGREVDILIRNLFETKFSEETYKRVLNFLTVAVLFSAVLFAAGFFNFKVGHGSSVPKGAVDFVENNRLQGNMFNDYGYGGYIAWRLYPWKKTFIDTRSLNLTVKTEYSLIESGVDFIEGEEPSIIKKPLWERLLNHYRINFVFLSLLDIYGQILPVIFKLIESDNWVPIYCDPGGVIVIRNTEQNNDIIEQFKISKDVVYDAIIFATTTSALFDRTNPRSLISLGDIFYKMGRLKEALIAYKYAFRRMPYPAIKEKINKVESEIEESK